LILGLSFFLWSCQTPPTKVKENLTVGPNADHSRVITPSTVVLDARPLFSYVGGHIPGAQPVRWDFFGTPENHGVLRSDSEAMARELSRLGVSPDTHVVVVGLGKSGSGEEGRVAWTLSYLGVKNVAFAREASFALKRKAGEAEPIANVPPWEPQVDLSLKVDKKELSRALRTNNPLYRIIDVSSVNEYLGRNPESRRHPDIGAVNIPWTEFIDDDDKPSRPIVSQLSSIGIGPDKRVVLICEEGVRSALATEVLRELGYKNAGNFAGGFKELFSESKKKSAKGKKSRRGGKRK
jgi:thiosulfate/3-mercaptopyruvate sulfurtransferase